MRWFLGILMAFSLVSAAHSQDSPYRKELKRADLTGTNMEVITSGGLSPMLHPAMGRVPLVFEPKGLGGATGRGAKPST